MLTRTATTTSAKRKKEGDNIYDRHGDDDVDNNGDNNGDSNMTTTE